MKNLLSTSLLLVVGVSHAYLPIPLSNVTATPNPPQRKDIDTLSSQELTLFVLAMQAWQKVSASNVGGYFQVAGIHGAPHVYWDNQGGFGTTTTGYDESGYCFHNDQNFYLWHRPYLALFEQQMIATAINISNTWYQPQRAAYQAAAATLRLPYWDWAKSSTPGTVPAVIANSQIQIANPSTGQTQTITNPLYSHTLVSDGNLGTYDDGTAISVGSRRTTYRSSSYQRNMQSTGSSLKRNTALLFNTPNVCWNAFATEESNERKQCNVNVPSMEGTHNTVHNTISGTMANLDVAAFDPIFWLHHCNVDRIGALWQAINPNTKVQPTYDRYGYTFVAGPGTRGDNYNYLPFRYSNANTAWWQPKMLYDVRANNYTYPEIADLPSSSTALSRVNAIYGNGRTQQSLSTKSSKRESRVSRRQILSALSNLIVPPTTAVLTPFANLLINRNGSFHEYAVTCTIQKSVAPGKSFTVHLFFGDVTTTDYLAASNRVGGFSVSQAGGSSMANSVSGVVPITDALLNLLVTGKVKDLKPATIRKYVRARLVWRIVTAEGTEVPVERGRNNGLQLKVQHSLVTPPQTQGDLPTVEAPEEIADTTGNTVAAPVPSDVTATTALPTATAAATGV